MVKSNIALETVNRIKSLTCAFVEQTNRTMEILFIEHCSEEFLTSNTVPVISASHIVWIASKQIQKK